jgi:hypothetical protein
MKPTIEMDTESLLMARMISRSTQSSAGSGWLGQALIAVMALSFLGFVLCLLVCDAGEPPKVRIKSAGAYVVVDDSGSKRAELSVDDAGLPAMILYDKSGVRRLLLCLAGDGSPALIFFGGDGKAERVRLAITEKGDAVLGLYGSGSAKPSLRAEASESGATSISFFDGKVDRLKFEVLNPGSPQAIRLLGDRPDCDLVLGLDELGIPQIVIRKDGEVVFRRP